MSDLEAQDFIRQCVHFEISYLNQFSNRSIGLNPAERAKFESATRRKQNRLRKMTAALIYLESIFKKENR